jgi:hypothetical protein
MSWPWYCPKYIQFLQEGISICNESIRASKAYANDFNSWCWNFKICLWSKRMNKIKIWMSLVEKINIESFFLQMICLLVYVFVFIRNIHFPLNSRTLWIISLRISRWIHLKCGCPFFPHNRWAGIREEKI